MLHADCPVNEWSRLEDTLNTHYKRSRAIAKWSRARLERENCEGVSGVRAVVAGHTPVAVPQALGNFIHIDTAGWESSGYFTLLNLDLATTHRAALRPDEERKRKGSSRARRELIPILP